MAKIKKPNIGKDVKQSEVLYIVFLEYKNGIMGFPGGSNGKESACGAGDPGSIPGLGSSPGERIGYPLQYSSASVVAQAVKNWWQSRVQSLDWEDPLKEGMATPASILAWTEEPGGLQSMGLHPRGQRSLAG